MTDEVPNQRLLLIDTVDQLPGLLPWHAFVALRTCDLILLGQAEHPMAAHFDMAEERYEVLPTDLGEQAVGRADLLAGLSLADKARASWVVERIKTTGAVAYVFGPEDTDAFTRTLGMESAREGIEVEVVYYGLAPKGLALLDLVGVEERLLAPGGCPWDAEQTHATLAKYAIEEAHELADAIATDDPVAIAEELGDVLLQVVFHAEMADGFDIDAVATGITEKLIRRHPHVFGGDDEEFATATDAGQVQSNWDAIKAAEKPERTGPFDGVPSGLPAMALAAKVQSSAERLGFVWEDAMEAAEKVAEELGEVLDAEGETETRDEIGDLLLAAISLARASGVDPEDALRRRVDRFRNRFSDVVDGLEPDEVKGLSPAEWRKRWDATGAPS